MSADLLDELMAGFTAPADAHADPTPAKAAKAAKNRMNTGVSGDFSVCEGLRKVANPDLLSQKFAALRKPENAAQGQHPCGFSQDSQDSQGFRSPDPDCWSWPNGSATNTAEIATFGARVVRFMARGLPAPEAERLADRLVTHDRDQDGLRCCLECWHLHGAGPRAWRCSAWRDAGIGAAAMGRDLATTPQRCPAFDASGSPE
jgi:hypothetical protein